MYIKRRAHVCVFTRRALAPGGNYVYSRSVRPRPPPPPRSPGATVVRTAREAQAKKVCARRPSRAAVSFLVHPRPAFFPPSPPCPAPRNFRYPPRLSLSLSLLRYPSHSPTGFSARPLATYSFFSPSHVPHVSLAFPSRSLRLRLSPLTAVILPDTAPLHTHTHIYKYGLSLSLSLSLFPILSVVVSLILSLSL